MTKQEILIQFDQDCKLQGGSQEAIQKALAKATIEIQYEQKEMIRAIGQTLDDRLTRIGDILEKVEITGEKVSPQA